MSGSPPGRESVWILKSTYRSDFRQRILTVLSLPTDAYVDVEYDAKWIDDDFKENLDAMKSKSAYFVFYDITTNPPEFYPLRLCELKAIQGGAPYKLILKVGKLLAFKDGETKNSFSKAIVTLLENRKLMKSGAVPTPDRLVLLCRDNSLAEKLTEVDGQEDTDWQRIVDYLTKAVPTDSTTQFTKSLFFRLQLIDEKNFQPLTLSDGKYKLQQGGSYLVRLRAYLPHWKELKSNGTANMAFSFNDQLLEHIGPNSVRMPLDERLYNKDFKVHVNKRLQGAETAIKFEREEDWSNASGYEVPLAIVARYGVIALWFLPFPIGLLLLGFADSIGKQLTASGLSTPSYLVTILGTVLCSIAIFKFQSK